MSEAFLFPGQGAQQVGMMADLAEASPAAGGIFELADAQMGFALSELCFAGPAERLATTDVCQPAIFICSAAALAAMEQTLGDSAPTPAMMAGLSLGEYTALYAAGAVGFRAALELVTKRAQLMRQAAEARDSGMVALIGIDEPQARKLCEAAAEAAAMGRPPGEQMVLVSANFNCPGQIVLSGDAAACHKAVELAKDFGAASAVPLKVAGAFHSPLMASAAQGLSEALAGVELHRPSCPVIANVDAAAHGQGPDIKEKLVAQLTSPTRWAQSMQFMLDNGVDTFYEVGPGRVLAGMMRRIDRKAKVISINSADALAKLAGQLAGGESREDE